MSCGGGGIPARKIANLIPNLNSSFDCGLGLVLVTLNPATHLTPAERESMILAKSSFKL